MGVQSLHWEDFLEEDLATHSSILAWRIPWTEDSCTSWSCNLEQFTYLLNLTLLICETEKVLSSQCFLRF